MAVWDFITGPQAWAFWTVVLSTSIFTAALNHLVDSIRAARKNRRSAIYLALRVAVQLENFADECAERASFNDYHKVGNGQYTDGYVTLPEFPAYPDDEDAWRALKVGLAARVLSLPNLMKSSQNRIVETQNISHGEGGESVCEQECVLRGADAWELATALRRGYALAEFVPANDFPAELKVEAAAVRGRRAEHITKNAAALIRPTANG